MTTANRVPKGWAEFHKVTLLNAVGKAPMVTISFEPLDFGRNILQSEYSLINLYTQLLRGAKLAETKYIAIAEDDVLYHKKHFELRPEGDNLVYDMNRWCIHSWGPSVYYHKPHIANCGLIAPRKLFISALSERFEKFGRKWQSVMYKEVGRNEYERRCRISETPVQKKYASQPYLCFSHPGAGDPTQKHKSKRMWPVRALEIPVWGRADKIREKFV